MQDTILRSILNKAIACHHGCAGDFSADEANSALDEILAIDTRAVRAAKDAKRAEEFQRKR